jgi:hypothetical protein
MKISDQLKTYIEHEFRGMIHESLITNIKRENYKKSWDTERQRIEDERDKKLKALLFLRDNMNDKYFQSTKNNIIEACESLKRKEGTSKQNPLKGSSHIDLNNYLYACYYLIKKENPDSKDSEIYKWIEEKLAENYFKAKGKTTYDTDNIRRKIYSYKKMPANSQKAINELIERLYNRFLQSRS